MDYEHIYDFLIELDRLKGVYRKSYLSDGSRHENSAEHSWHLVVVIMMMKDEFPDDLDFLKTFKMALVHDVCEIGAGDISVYDAGRALIQSEERAYLEELTRRFPGRFTDELYSLWEEYEAQDSPESQWVKVFDRLLPFCMNLATEGRSWKEQQVRKHQVLAIHEPIRRQDPKMYEWVKRKTEAAVARGWLVE